MRGERNETCLMSGSCSGSGSESSNCARLSREGFGQRVSQSRRLRESAMGLADGGGGRKRGGEEGNKGRADLNI